MANIQPTDLVFDLYTGTGTIALFMAEKAKEVVGIELVPEAIADAKINAENNHIDNATFYVGDMKDVFTDAVYREARASEYHCDGSAEGGYA
jgi:23S rRNA (uracil1939-C5)-methyltransferase